MTWETSSVGSHVSYLVLVELVLETGAVRVHDGVGSVNWGGVDWSGVGDFGAISTITAGGDLTAAGITLTLSGIPSDYRTELLNATSRGADVNIYHGFVDENAGAWAHEPELAFAGIIDTSRLVDGTDQGDPTVSISVNIISAAARARRLTLYRRSFAHQQTLFEGDRFYEFRTDLRTPVPGAAGGAVRVTTGGGAASTSARAV